MNNFNVNDDLKIYDSVDEIRKHQPNHPFAVCALNILGDLNLGNIMRTSSIVGAEKFFIAGKRHWDRRSAVGVHNYIDFNYLPHMIDEQPDYKKIIAEIISHGYTPVFIEQGGIDFEKSCIEIIKKPCFIFGNEGIGIPENVMLGYYKMSLKQWGVTRSYNVSVAAGIVLYQYALKMEFKS